MVWCGYCGRDQEAEVDEANGFSCCTGCGRVLDDAVFSSDVAFLKQSDGSTQAAGHFVPDSHALHRIPGAGGRMLPSQSDSHQRTVARGKDAIMEAAQRLGVRPREDMVETAHRLYQVALQKNFTRGRKVAFVAAAALYIVCRQERKPYLLIDFADLLSTNVYVLGAVYLQLLYVLRLQHHPVMQAPVDPSLFIHRFADKLKLGRKMHPVANTALRIVASMKRDWIQTGRKPSGICGAALFIACHIHGFERSKGEVVSVVHVCEATVKKRLVEFEGTESGGLKPEEFELKAVEWEKELKSAQSVHMLAAQQQALPVLPQKGPPGWALASTTAAKANPGQAGKGDKGSTLAEGFADGNGAGPANGPEGEEDNGGEGEVITAAETQCEHRSMGAVHFAHGLCRPCYDEFVSCSGGLFGGTAPPSFLRAEAIRAQEAADEESEAQGLPVPQRPVKGRLSVAAVFGEPPAEGEGSQTVDEEEAQGRAGGGEGAADSPEVIDRGGGC